MHELLDPKVLAQIKNLPLLSKKIIEGTMSGLQHSHQKGAGLEFSQYRNYEQGDDLRLIDWKLFARTDRYYVRESLRESLVDVWFLLDCSASMGQPSQRIDNWTRFDYAKHLIASLASIITKHGDAPGLIALNDQQLEFIDAHRGQRHLEALIDSLSNIKLGQQWPAEEQLETMWEHIKRPAMIVIVSDGIQASDELEQLVNKFTAAGREVINFQLLTEAERHFNFKGNLALRDPETDERINVNTPMSRKAYLETFEAYLEELQKAMRMKGVDHREVLIESPLDESLRNFLNHRLKGVGF